METYPIGQEIFWARMQSQEICVQCPDCCGKRYLTVIMGDDSQVTIECTGCKSGYDPPRGTVRVVQYRPQVVQGIVTGIEIKKVDGITHAEYRIDGGGCVPSEDLSTLEDFAKRRAEEKAAQLSEYDLEKFYSKEKPKRDWGWNATYHRGCIKHAKDALAYHTAKLQVALTHKGSEK